MYSVTSYFRGVNPDSGANSEISSIFFFFSHARSQTHTNNTFRNETSASGLRSNTAALKRSTLNFRPQLAFVWPLAPIPRCSSFPAHFPLTLWRIVLRRFSAKNAPSRTHTHARAKVKPLLLPLLVVVFPVFHFTREEKPSHSGEKRGKTSGKLRSANTSGVREGESAVKKYPSHAR